MIVSPAIAEGILPNSNINLVFTANVRQTGHELPVLIPSVIQKLGVFHACTDNHLCQVGHLNQRTGQETMYQRVRLECDVLVASRPQLRVKICTRSVRTIGNFARPIPPGRNQ